MTKTKKYKYIGTNGILTTHIQLEGIKSYPLFELKADPGMILTNEEYKAYIVTVSPEEVELWKEIPKDNSN